MSNQVERKTFIKFMDEGATEKRILARALKRQLPNDFSYGGVMSLVAMADEDVMSVKDVVKVVQGVQGVGKFTESKLSGGMKAKYADGMVTVSVSSGKLRIEFS